MENTQTSAIHYYTSVTEGLVRENQNSENSHLPLLNSNLVGTLSLDNGTQIISTQIVHNTIEPADETRANTAVEHTTFNSSITIPSVFAIPQYAQSLAKTIDGLYFQVYDLPTQDYNCGLFGIYGRRVTRDEVVNQLLESIDNRTVRELTALDIISMLLQREALPHNLEMRRGQYFRKLISEYNTTNGSEEIRQSLLKRLQEESIFRDYVIDYIGGHVGDIPGNPYNMLTYERNNFNGGGVLGAIAAMNNVGLDIYQEFRQGDGSRLLVKVFSQPNDQANGRVISLLHMSQDPINSSNLNHFQLLVPEATEIVNENSREDLSSGQIEKEAAINVNVVEVNNNGITVLMWAISKGPMAIQSLLSVPSINVNAVDKDSGTVLMYAAANDYAEVIEALLTAPSIDVNMFNKHGRTALMLAAKNGHIAAVKALLTSPSINDIDIPSKGEWSNVILTDNNAIDNDGRTALMLAVRNGHKEIVQVLLAIPEIDVNVADKYGDTALIMAAKGGQTEIVKILLAIPGIEWTVHSALGWFASIVSGCSYVDEETVQTVQALLTDPRSGVNALSKRSWEWEMSNDNQSFKSPPSIDINASYTLLMLAAYRNDIGMVETLLLASSVDVNIANENGDTALMLAARWGHTSIVQELLKVPGVNVNAVDKKGKTALMRAAMSGHTEVVRTLLAIPTINIDIVKRGWFKNRTALQLAQEKGYVQIVQAIQEVINGRVLIIAAENKDIKSIQS